MSDDLVRFKKFTVIAPVVWIPRVIMLRDAVVFLWLLWGIEVTK